MRVTDEMVAALICSWFGLKPDDAWTKQDRYEDARLALTAALTESEEDVFRDGAMAGWNACRRQVYLLSEHFIDETHPLKNTETVAGNFYRGQYDVAKSFAKAFNAFEASDCDEVAKVLAARTQESGA